MITTRQMLGQLCQEGREVMQRLSMHRVSVVLNSCEPRLLAAAADLAGAGWLLSDQSYSYAGRTYERYLPAPRLDMRELREWWQ